MVSVDVHQESILILGGKHGMKLRLNINFNADNSDLVKRNNKENETISEHQENDIDDMCDIDIIDIDMNNVTKETKEKDTGNDKHLIENSNNRTKNK